MLFVSVKPKTYFKLRKSKADDKPLGICAFVGDFAYMQCPTCNVVYSNGLDNCPRCKTPAPQVSVSEVINDSFAPEIPNSIAVRNDNEKMTDIPSETKSHTSTLITFPGTKRQELPQWKKDLLEKFKEVQDKRAREAEEAKAAEGNSVSENSSEAAISTNEDAAETGKHHLEVVPTAEPAPINPIVAKALERIERAHNKPLQTTPKSQPQTEERVAAVAGMPKEKPVQEKKLTLIQPQQTQPKTAAMGASASTNAMPMLSRSNGSSRRSAASTAPKLLPNEETGSETISHSVITSQAVADISPTTTNQFTSGQISKASAAAGIESVKTENTKAVLKEVSSQASETLGTLSDPPTDSIEGPSAFMNDPNPFIFAEEYNDYAPITSRIVSVFFDILVILFAASPFAAILELNDVDWTNQNIQMSLGAVVLIVAFFYLMASVAMLGRTWGMGVLSLRVTDAKSGLPPSFLQSTGRTFIFLLSLAAFCLPFLYTLFNAEGRALHDRIVGTIVLREE